MVQKEPTHETREDRSFYIFYLLFILIFWPVFIIGKVWKVYVGKFFMRK